MPTVLTQTASPSRGDASRKARFEHASSGLPLKRVGIAAGRGAAEDQR